jgi:hypothetical protein
MRLGREERLILDYLYDHPHSRTGGCLRQEILKGTDLSSREGDPALSWLLTEQLVRHRDARIRITPDGEAEVEQWRSWAGRLARSRGGKAMDSLNDLIDRWAHAWKLLLWLVAIVGAFILGRLTSG